MDKRLRSIYKIRLEKSQKSIFGQSNKKAFSSFLPSFEFDKILLRRILIGWKAFYPGPITFSVINIIHCNDCSLSSSSSFSNGWEIVANHLLSFLEGPQIFQTRWGRNLVGLSNILSPPVKSCRREVVPRSFSTKVC